MDIQWCEVGVEELELSTYEGSTMEGNDQWMFAGLKAERKDDVCFDLVIIDSFESDG